MYSKSKFRFELYTQERVLLTQDVCYVLVPSVEGPLGVLPGHAPLIGILSTGILRVRDLSNKEFSLFVGRGFFLIARECMTVVANIAELKHQINLEAALAEREQARNILAAGGSARERETAKNALLQAETKIKIAQEASP